MLQSPFRSALSRIRPAFFIGRAGTFRFFFALVCGGLFCALPVLTAQETERPLIYTGELNYTKPSSFGFFGYRRTAKNDRVPPTVPAAPSDLTSQPLSSRLNVPQTKAQGIETENGLFLPPASAAAQDTDSMIPPPTDDDAFFSPINAPAAPDERLSSFMLTPRPERNSLCQGAAAFMSYIPNAGEKRSGQTALGGSITLGFPLPDEEHFLFLTPDIRWVDFTLPSAEETVFGKKAGLYSTGGEARYLFPACDALLMDLAVGVHWNSDFKASNSKALRITGRACGLWRMSDQARLLLGAAYTDLSDWPVVPVAGIIWQPSDDLSVEAYFPRPKISRRLSSFSRMAECDASYWAYLAGEMEFNRAVFQPDSTFYGAPNAAQLTYYDYRFLAGLERRATDDLNWAIEGGVVFGRDLKLESLDSRVDCGRKYHPDTSGVVRLKIMY